MGALRGAAVLVAAGMLILSCAGDPACDPAAETSSCGDLLFRGGLYEEWREVDVPPPGQMQEVGNATYPACNAAAGCPGAEFDGFGATDVWLAHGVRIDQAVIGVREGTDAYVLFIRFGVDPDALRPLLDPGLLASSGRGSSA